MEQPLLEERDLLGEAVDYEQLLNAIGIKPEQAAQWITKKVKEDVVKEDVVAKAVREAGIAEEELGNEALQEIVTPKTPSMDGTVTTTSSVEMTTAEDKKGPQDGEQQEEEEEISPPDFPLLPLLQADDVARHLEQGQEEGRKNRETSTAEAATSTSPPQKRTQTSEESAQSATPSTVGIAGNLPAGVSVLNGTITLAAAPQSLYGRRGRRKGDQDYLWQMERCDDPEVEERRRRAVRAKKNRMKQKEARLTLVQELDKLREEVEVMRRLFGKVCREKDALKQQVEQLQKGEREPRGRTKRGENGSASTASPTST